VIDRADAGRTTTLGGVLRTVAGAIRRRLGCVTTTVVGLMLVAAIRPAAAAALADEATEAQVKAAFLLNFAKFGEWPPIPADLPIVVCVLGDDAIVTSVVNLTSHETLAGRRVEVRRQTPSNWAAADSCHVLFIARERLGDAARTLTKIRTEPIMTISDAPQFASNGGIIELYVDHDHMKFAINLDALERSGLHLSSRLLGLARIVRDTRAP
jgi:hypothetical protein